MSDDQGDQDNEELTPVSDREAERIAAIARAAYHQPPAAPRENMWQAIAASRQSSSATPIASGRRAPWWIAIAAAAVLAAGIGIGRITAPGDEPVEVTAADPTGGVVIPGTGFGGDATGPAAGQSSRRPPSSSPSPRSGTQNGVDASDATYRLATLQHLAQSEMLLTEYRAGARSSDRPTLGLWARDLLGTTRLLMDSPAADDARLRPLLEDLELVLAQIVQHSSDDEFVNRALEERALLEKLRAAVPAGAVISGSE